MNPSVIGLDFGTDSVRAVVVDAINGSELSTAVAWYPRWRAGRYCIPARNQYRQHPLDYLESMTEVILMALKEAPAGTREMVKAISFDTTGSTPVLVDRQGTPLALTPGFEENPNAMFVLWKDHTAIHEASEINDLAGKWSVDYTRFEGGIYSSEWVWAKVLHILREDEQVRKAAHSWIEHCDWMPAILTGNVEPEKVVRSRCAAGHKAMWHEDFGGLPSEEFLSTLDPVLSGYRSRLFINTFTADHKVGHLNEEWAEKLGLSSRVAVGAGAFDCHMGAVGGGITPYALVRVMGTSTCDIMVAPYDDMKGRLVRGICGQVDGSVVPGMIGLEAGQSAFGDVYAWFKNLLGWSFREMGALTQDLDDKIIPVLSEAAMKLPDDDSIPLATDWFNGRRTPDADQAVKASIDNLHLGTSAPMLFKSLVEATAFGSRAIAERFAEEGVPIKEVIAIGGVAKKSPLVMQVLADVMNMEIQVADTDQSCAHGAAMFAAVVAGIYKRVEEAMAAMGQGFESTYLPDPAKVEHYNQKYSEYQKLAYRKKN